MGLLKFKDRAYLYRNFHKMYIHPFLSFYPKLSQIKEKASFFDATKEHFTAFWEQGFFEAAQQPAIFLYQIEVATRVYTGVLACVDIAEYLSGNIKKHENTIQSEQDKQMRLTLERRAAVKPVLLTYAEQDKIDDWIGAFIAEHLVFLTVDFPGEKQIHRLWAVQEKQAVEALQTLFADLVEHAYIADGHHRMEAMAGICQTNGDPAFRQIYCAFFPSQQLDILEFNRIVIISDLALFLQKLSTLFDISFLKRGSKPSQKHEMTLCTAQGWYRLRWKFPLLQALGQRGVLLDTVLLNEEVLHPLLGINNYRSDLRVSYLDSQKGLGGIEKVVQESPNSVGFCMYPIVFEDLAKTVEAGRILPPKSTWFEPRMKNGLIVKCY